MNLKVLVIDDDFADEIAERLQLTYPDWQVDTARGVRSADTKLRNMQIDAVVVDMRMEPESDIAFDSQIDVANIAPENAGLAVLKILPGLEQRPAAAILTAFGSPTNIVRAIQLGADAYLSKDDLMHRPRKVADAVADAVARRAKFNADPELPNMLERARAVQVNSHPLPAMLEGVSIAGANLPAMRLSGDNFFFSDFSKARKTRFMLCDAAGKGPYAALLSGSLYSVFRLGIDSEWSLEKIDESLHLATMRLTSESSFATGVVGEFNARTNELDFIAAGHDPPILAGKGSASFAGTSDKIGLPWGLTDTDGARAAPARETVPLPEQHSLLFYSDGLTDVPNPAEDDRYGKDRLIESHRVSTHKNAADLCESIIFNALGFGGLVSLLFDDMTVIAIHRGR